MSFTGHNTKRSRRIAVLSIVALLAAALPVAHAATTEGSSTSTTTSNDAPTVATPALYTSDPSATAGSTCPAGGVTSFDPTVGGTTTIYVCAVVTDTNGWSDVCDGTATTDNRAFDIENSGNVVLKDNTTLTCATGSGTDVAVTGSIPFEYWRPVGTATGANAYELIVSVTDVSSATGTGAVNFDWTALTALDAPNTISLGSSVTQGTTTTPAEAVVSNLANTAFTISVKGTALTGATHGQTISVGSMQWATTSAGTYTGLTTSAASTGVNVPVATSDSGSADSVWLRVNVPAGSSQWIPKDTYSGTITFSTS